MKMFFSLLKNLSLFIATFFVVFAINVFVSLLLWSYFPFGEYDKANIDKNNLVEFYFVNASNKEINIEFISDEGSVFIESIDASSQKYIAKYIPTLGSFFTLRYLKEINSPKIISENLNLYYSNIIYCIANAKGEFIIQQVNSRNIAN